MKTLLSGDNEEACERAVDLLYGLYNDPGKSPQQAALAAITHLYDIPLERAVGFKFLDGVQFGLVLAATRPTAAGAILEFLATTMQNRDVEVQIYVHIIARLLERLEQGT